MAEIVEALYDFQPQSGDDVELRRGQQIEVYEHLSEDWMRGKNLDSGHEGVFPANYVRPAEQKRSFSRPAAKIPGGQSDYPQPYNDKEQYQAPSQQSWNQPPPPSWGQQQQFQPPQYQQYAPPQQQYAPPQQQYQPPQQAMMPEQPQQQPQQAKHHGQFGNLARRFGDSVMFGAGATLGSDIINKIF